MKFTKLITVVALLAVLVLPAAVAPTPVAAQTPRCVTDKNCQGFPDFDDMSGKFVNVTRGFSSLGDVATTQNIFNIELKVPVGLTAFELAVFDGNMGGYWDPVSPPGATPDQITFKLYSDPTVEGKTDVLLHSWPAADMPDNGWCVLSPDLEGPSCKEDAVIPQYRDACLGPREGCFYHLVADWDTTTLTHEQNNFKVAGQGTPFMLAGSTIGFIGYGPADPHPWVFPPSTYDGSWTFRFDVPEPATEILLWDGDMDRADDSDDANSPPLPPNCGESSGVCPDPPGWDPPAITFPPFPTSPITVIEGAHAGRPADDAVLGSPLRITPPVVYHVTDPTGLWTVTNEEPSGDKEWELFKITLADTGDQDRIVEAMPAGLYRWDFEGLDGRNTVFLHSQYDVYPGPASLGNTVWCDMDEDGYWDGNPLGSTEEPGIANVRVDLYEDRGTIGALDPADVPLGSQLTDSNGQYKFDDLEYPKDYLVVVNPSNFDPDGPLRGLGSVPAFDAVTKPDDHWNRLEPWPAFVPTNLYYANADSGYGPYDFCVWNRSDPDNSATGDWTIHVDGEGNPESITIRTTLNLAFADTAWGGNPPVDTGWPGKGRKFKQISTSDNLEMTLLDASGTPAIQFGLDLLEPSSDPDAAPSGWKTEGPFGGDGYLGDLLEGDVVDYNTSISVNLNNHPNPVSGSACYWDDKSSPAVSIDADGNYVSDCADWIWETWYEITIDYAVFDGIGFGGVEVYALHSSPSKTGDETPPVEECDPNLQCFPLPLP